MNKETKKTALSYNQTAIEVLVGKFGLSPYYIKQSINGNKQGITPDSIKKEYTALVKELQKVEKITIDQFLKS